MIEVVNIAGFETQTIVKTMLDSDDSLLFLVNKESPDDEMYFSKLIKWNCSRNKKEEWPFTEQVGIVSNRDRGKNVLYYAATKWEKGIVHLAFYQFTCSTFQNSYAGKIEIIDSTGTTLGDSEISHTELYGIDERYCIVVLPRMIPDMRLPLFSKVFVLDSLEKKLYEVHDEIFTDDSLTRIDQLYVEESQGISYLFVKTGRSTITEKKEWFQKKCEATEGFSEEKESIIVVETDLFIRSVKEKKPVGPQATKDVCMKERAFSLLNFGGTVFYCRYDFIRNCTEIIEIVGGNLEKKMEIKGIYNRIIQAGRDYFLIKIREGKQELIDLKSEKIMYTTLPNEKIVTGNDKFVITYHSGTSEIYFYDPMKATSNKLGTGSPSFDSSRNRLVIFTS